MADDDRPRRSISVTPEQQGIWADLDALAAEQGRPLSVLVNEAVEQFALLRAYRAGKAHERRAALASVTVSA